VSLTIDCRYHGEQLLVPVGESQHLCTLCADEARSARKCACNCGEPLINRSAQVRYVNERHKQRAHRRRLKAAAEAAGLPTSLSLKAIESATSTGNRRGDGHASAGKPQRTRSKPRKPSLRISYRKAVKQVARHIAHNGDLGSKVLVRRGPWEAATREAESLLSPLLTDRQRAAL
jgi:hypothetical protein